MKGLSGKRVEIPSMEEITQERKRLSYRRRYKRVLKSTVYALVVVAAIAVLLATNLLPVLQVSGDSMNPTLQDQDILVLLKTDALEKGLVTVNGEVLEEPYVDEPALGECDLSFPYQVPENRFFVMGDHRATSIDSRSTVVGCVEKSQIVGKVFLRVWPVSRISWIG